MINEPNEHEEMRAEINKIMRIAVADANSILDGMPSPESRLGFIQEYYLPVIAGLAEALGHIKP